MVEDRDAAVWAAVVMQAREDAETLPIGSTDYESAVAFLTSNSAYWRAARDDVASHLYIHGDDIRRAGVRWVIGRRRAAGLPDHPVPSAPKPPAPTPATKAERMPLVIPQLLREAMWARRRRAPADNPFAPAA